MTVMAMMQILIRMSIQESIYWLTVFRGKVKVITEEQVTAEGSDGQQERKGVLLMGH